ncbi:restriction endonuclease subunit S [Fusobacterium gonidiaformans]|uniref:restriction endonuclease subunit S n=1 Tax=Fusobacterium gonidiaformans TaxID=849 RepID=UPI00307F0443
MGKWKEYNIGELGEVITGKTPSTKNEEYWNGNVMFITPKDIQGSKHIFQTERYISDLGKNKIQSSILPMNAICVSCIGVIGYLGMTTQESVSNQQINSIIVNKKNNVDFVYYSLKNLWNYFKKYEGQSTTLSILNKTQFSKIKVKIPDKIIQNRIASILCSLDNKIEINNKINDNLAA